MMQRNWTFIAVFALLIVMGIILGRMFSTQQTVDEEVAAVPFLDFDQSELLFEPPPLRLFSEAVVVPPEEPAEPVAPPELPAVDPLPSALSALFAEPAEEPVITEPTLPPATIFTPPATVLAEEAVAVVEDEVVVIEQPVPAPEPAPAASVVETPDDTPASAASTESLAPGSYVYFFTGVPVQPAPMTYFTYSGFTFMSVSVVPAPAVQPTYVAPVFVPQVVPSRMGASRWVYSNVYSHGAFMNSQVYFPQPVYNAVYVIAP